MIRRASEKIIRGGGFTLMAALALLFAGCRADGIIDGETPDPTREPGQAPAPMGGGGASAPVVGGNNGSGTMGAPAAGLSQTMPQDVLALLQGRCAGCHTYGQADPVGFGSILDLSRLIAADVVVPGDPNASRLIDRVAVVGDMPPKGDRLKAEEITMLKDWITNMKRPANFPLTDTDVLDAISVDQLTLRDRSADYRYVSFAHFIGQGRSAEEMEAVRQVFIFTLNSLSRRGTIVDPPTIDPDRSIFRLQLTELGWDEALWDQVTAFYPYCMRSDAVPHEALYVQLGTEAPVVRGDWFLAEATKAPLYDLLVDTPDTLDELAARLGVDINDDINHPGLAEPDNLVRVGFRRSGVALHNRMLERHLGAQGQAFWVSYDFDSNEGDADLLANPLGPKDRDQQDFVHTFQHAGGEVIYTMPNGLQGYMLVDAVGNRLDEAPINIVRDPRRTNGVVENGISCFGCHARTGILRPRDTDEVARYVETHIAQFEGRELNEIEASYPRILRPDYFTEDSRRYRQILDILPDGGPTLGDGEYGEFVALVGQYESTVGFRGAASEFYEEFESFRDRFFANDFQNDSLPRTTTAPLVQRDDFICVFRDIVQKIRPNAVFCDGTFLAAAVGNQCSGTSASVGPLSSSSQSSRPSSSSSSTSTSSRNSSSSSGSGGSSGAGGSSGSSSGSGGSSGSSNDTPDAGAPADGGSAKEDCEYRRVNGRWVCQ